MKKLLAMMLAVILTLGLLTACGNNNGGGNSTEPTDNGGSDDGAASDVQVAAIFGGAINDGNWNETQYNGLKAVEGKGAKISYLENIGDTDASESARAYASEGYGLIYLTTNSYQDHCTPIAAEYPDVKFVQINGTEITDNFISVRIADEEQGFMQGVIAALLTETGRVGFVGGQEINPIILGASGFEQGVEYVNEKYGKNVVADVQLTGSFTDVNQAKETTIAMIEKGADIVAPMANDASVAIMEAAEEKGVMAIGCGMGQETSAPNGTQVNVIKDVAIAIEVTFDAFVNGTLSATEVETYGANKGVVFLTDWFADVDQEIKDQVAEVMESLVNGDIEIKTN